MKKIILTILVSSTILVGCTKNQRVRQFGGTEEIVLKPNEKLLNITWKEKDIWVLTEDTLTKVKYFRESSSFGIWQGEVIIK